MNNKKVTSIFDESALANHRLLNESFQSYKDRQRQNKKFLAMYKKFGRTTTLQYIDFIKTQLLNVQREDSGSSTK